MYCGATKRIWASAGNFQLVQIYLRCTCNYYISFLKSQQPPTEKDEADEAEEKGWKT